MTPDLVIAPGQRNREADPAYLPAHAGGGLIVGVAIGLLQSVTQIQEVTLVLVPKIVAILVTLLFTLPWIMNKMMDYTESTDHEHSRVRQGGPVCPCPC